MIHTTDVQPGNTTSTGTSGSGADQPRERRAGERRVSIEQEKADFAAWLREYRRWTQTGCCAPTRSGDIEWGGEDGASH
jgi:hypothetical protein